METSLISSKCVPCRAGESQLSETKIKEYLEQVENWHLVTIDRDSQMVKTLQKRFQFKDFRQAMAFLRDVETLAESENHHPDFSLHYNIIDFTLYTHVVGGLHQNDFILAAELDQLASGLNKNS